MNDSYDVVVVGGGIVGLSAAIAMRQKGLRVALMDAGPIKVPLKSARVYAMNHTSVALLTTLGVWSRMDKTRDAPYRRMHVWDAVSLGHIDFDARMIAAERLGTIVAERTVKQALLDVAGDASIEFIAHCKIASIASTPQGLCLTCDDKIQRNTQLLVVADGAFSTTRELLGVTLTHWSYHQEAIVATIQVEKSHQQTAYQVFHPDGPLAFLPLAKDTQCSIVWSTTPAKAERLMAQSSEAFEKELTDAFAAQLGQCTLVGERYLFPLHMRHANTYTGSNWLLMGDAAHTIHPMAGLGLNLGLADLAAWLTYLDTKALTSKKALGMYQRQRKNAVWQAIALMEGLKTLFANPLPPFALLRGIGLRLCNGSALLKRFFIEQAD